MATHNRFFSFFSAVDFVVVVAFAPFLNKEEELFFFSEKLLSFLPLFFGASFTHKKSPFIRYTIIVYETRADNIYLYATHAFL